jgi:hypothetical protein
MKFYKITALLLCAAMALVLCTGCAKEDETDADTSPNTETSTDTDDSTSSLDLAAAYETYAPDEVILTVDGRDVTWQEYFYALTNVITMLQNNGVTITDWSAEVLTGMTLAEYVKENAAELYIQYAAIDVGAQELNCTLTEEDQQSIQDQWDAAVEQYGSEEAFLDYLDGVYATKELYDYIIEKLTLGDRCSAELFGEKGANLTDADLAEYYADSNYIMAKHILIQTVTTDEDGNQVALSDEEIAERRAQIEDIYSQLTNYTGDDFDGYFTELMNEYSEDGGLASYPNGYVFREGDMVQEFEDTAYALEVGEMSEIITTDYGYHIIYRVPLDYNETPSEYKMYKAYGYDDYTLRAMAASNMFNSRILEWEAAVNVEYTQIFDEMDMAEIFKIK